MATKKTLNESVKSEVKEEVKAEKTEQRVPIMVPYVEGQDPEVTVIINGHVTKFRKGAVVEVPLSVAKVIANSNHQMMSALQNQEKFRNMRTDL